MKQPRRTFRFVCATSQRPAVEALLHEQGFEFEPEPFYEMAGRLIREPFPLGESLAARFGYIYIQDRSSMLPPLLLNPPEGAGVLDMCSAPGSKTSLLSLLTGPGGFVFASEPSADRIGTLRANLRRMNAANAATTKMQAQDLPFSESSWDYIQLDPPCSGWGTVDKNPKVMELWSEAKTGPLVTLQKTLLAKANAMLRPGGSVLFSTCTTNEAENEAQVEWALDALGLELTSLAPPEGFEFDAPKRAGLDGVLRVSEESAGQGFFLARLRKPDDACAPERKTARPDAFSRSRRELASMRGVEEMTLDNLPPGEVHQFGSKLYFLHEKALELVPQELRWQGFFLGKTTGRGEQARFIPNGMCRILMPKKLAAKGGDVLAVDEAARIEQLLSGQSLSFKPGAPLVGLYYRDLPMAWLSRKGKRVVLSSK